VQLCVPACATNLESVGFIVSEILPFKIMAFCFEIAYLCHFHCMHRMKAKFTSEVETIHIFGFVGTGD